MPTVLMLKGFRFHFYASDEDEPIHVHVSKGNGYAKIWLEPDIEAQYFHGFKAQDQKKIMKIVTENSELLKTKWNEFFK